MPGGGELAVDGSGDKLHKCVLTNTFTERPYKWLLDVAAYDACWGWRLIV